MQPKILSGCFLIGLFLIQLPGFSQNPLRFNLQQVIETAIKNNPLVQQQELQTQRDKISLDQSKADRLPNLNANINNGLSQGRSIDPFTNAYSNNKISYSSYNLGSNVILFNGSSLKNSIKQNELTYQATVMDLQQVKDNLTIDVVLAYLDMLNNEDLLVQLKTQSALTNRQVERLMILDSSGAISPLLLSDMRGQYASDQLLILNAENAAENSRISLFRLMNIPYQKNAEFEKLKVADLLTKYPVTSQQVYDEALNKFPQVKADELRKKSAQKSIEIAKGQLLPVLSLSGAISTNYSNAARNEIFLNTTEISTTDYVTVSGNKLPVIRQQNNYSSQKIAYGSQLNNNLATSLNLNLRIPIFNSFQTKNRIKLTTINLKETELAVINTKTSLQQFIEEAYANMNNALERYKVLLKQYEAYKESFRIAEVRFNSGLGTVIDYLTAKTNLERTAANLIIEKYNYLLRTKVLDYYRGNPLN